MLISALSLQATDVRSPVRKLKIVCAYDKVQQLPGIWPTFRGHGVKMDKKTFWDN